MNNHQFLLGNSRLLNKPPVQTIPKLPNVGQNISKLSPDPHAAIDQTQTTPSIAAKSHRYLSFPLHPATSPLS